MPGRIYASSKERLLESAERVMLREGLGGLSVDAVVAEAGMSKGGFFHHFATRDALLAELLLRLSEHVTRLITARDGKQPLRARVELAFEMPPKERQRLRALVIALVEAATASPKVAASARRANQAEVALAVKSGVPEGAAWVVQLALDGLWLGETFGTLMLTPKQRGQLRAALEKLTR